MGSPLNVFDPEADSIVIRIINDAMDSAVTDNPRENLRKNQRISHQHAPTLRHDIVLGIVKRAEIAFREKNNQDVLLDEAQLQRVQQHTTQHLNEKLKAQELAQRAQQAQQSKTDPNHPNKNQDKSREDKSNLKKLLAAALFVVSLKYSLLAFAKRNALKRLLKRKKLAAYLKRKRKKRRLAAEKEAQANPQQGITAAESNKDEAEAEKELKRDLMLWGDLFTQKQEQELSLTLEALERAVTNAENLGDNIYDGIFQMQRELGLPPMSAAQMLQWKQAFKDALLDMDTQLITAQEKTPEGMTRLPDNVMNEIYAKFENTILQPLEKIRNQITQQIFATENNVTEKLAQLDAGFLGFSQSLNAWASGGDISRQTQNIALSDATIRQQQQQAAEQAKASGTSSTLQFGRQMTGQTRHMATQEAVTNREAGVPGTSKVSEAPEASETAPEKPSRTKPSPRPTPSGYTPSQ